MAYAIAQSGAQAQSGGAHTLTATFVNNVAAGGILFLVYGGRGNAGLSSVTDDQSQTWTKRVERQTGNPGDAILQLYTCPVTVAGTKPAVTFAKSDGDNFMGGTIFEVSGLDASATIVTSGVDGNLNGVGPNSPVAVATSGNASANSQFALICGFISGGTTMSTHTGFTQIDYVDAGLRVKADYLTAGATNGAPFTGTIDMGGGDGWSGIAAVFSLASGGGPTFIAPPPFIIRQAVKRASYW